MEQEKRNHLRESILHKELEEALKVKVVKTLEVEGVVEELVKEESRDHLKEAADRFQATLYQLNQAIS